MPGFDGRGPMGEGSMTGGGRGLCNPGGRGAAGTKRTFYGRRAGFGGRGRWPAVPMAQQSEIEMLKAQAESMENELKTIKARLGQLNSNSKE